LIKINLFRNEIALDRKSEYCRKSSKYSSNDLLGNISEFPKVKNADGSIEIIMLAGIGILYVGGKCILELV